MRKRNKSTHIKIRSKRNALNGFFIPTFTDLHIAPYNCIINNGDYNMNFSNTSKRLIVIGFTTAILLFLIAALFAHAPSMPPKHSDYFAAYGVKALFCFSFGAVIYELAKVLNRN